MDMMTALQNEGAVEALARDTGVDEQTAQSGMAALLPSILGGLQHQATSSPQGIGGLASILGGLGGGGLFSNVLGSQPTDVGQGNTVLGQIFGSKDGSRAVANEAAQQSGLSPDLLKKMLPIVAMLAAGYFAKKASSAQGGLGGDDNGMGGLAGAGGGLGGMLGGLLGGGASGGGGVLDSILGGLTRR